MAWDLKDKVAIITGASSGIGQAMARRLAGQGCHVALAARRVDRLEALRLELEAKGVQVLALAVDVTLEADQQRLVDAVEARFGGLDILANNAGILRKGLAGQEPLATYRENMETNFFAAIGLTQRCLPMLRRRERSAVLFTSSGLALRSTPGLSAYCATKGALEAYADSLAVEERGRGVRVTLLRPDVTATEMVSKKTAQQSPDAVAALAVAALHSGRRVVNCTLRVSLLAHTHEPLRRLYDWGTLKLMKKGYLP